MKKKDILLMANVKFDKYSNQYLMLLYRSWEKSHNNLREEERYKRCKKDD